MHRISLNEINCPRCRWPLRVEISAQTIYETPWSNKEIEKESEQWLCNAVADCMGDEHVKYGMTPTQILAALQLSIMNGEKMLPQTVVKSFENFLKRQCYLDSCDDYFRLQRNWYNMRRVGQEENRCNCERSRTLQRRNCESANQHVFSNCLHEELPHSGINNIGCTMSNAEYTGRIVIMNEKPSSKVDSKASLGYDEDTAAVVNPYMRKTAEQQSLHQNGKQSVTQAAKKKSVEHHSDKLRFVSSCSPNGSRCRKSALDVESHRQGQVGNTAQATGTSDVEAGSKKRVPPLHIKPIKKEERTPKVKEDYFCAICNADFDNEASWKCHIANEKHRRNLAASNNFYCAICDMACTNWSNWRGHLAGKRHKRHEQTMFEKDYFCAICNAGFDNEGSWKCHIANEKHRKNLEASNNFYCAMCDVDCTNWNNWNLHVASRRHKRLEQTMGEKGIK